MPKHRILVGTCISTSAANYAHRSERCVSTVKNWVEERSSIGAKRCVSTVKNLAYGKECVALAAIGH